MNKTVLRRILTYSSKYNRFVFGIFLCAFFGNMLTIFSPFFMGNAIDAMIGEGRVEFQQLLQTIGILLVIYMGSSLFQWLLSVQSSVVANKIIHDLRKDAFEKQSRLPLKYFDNHAHGDIISRLTNDIDSLSLGLFQGITQVMSASITILGCIVFMLTISLWMTFLVLLFTPLCIFIASYITRHSKSMFSDSSKAVGELNGFVEEMIGNQSIVKGFGYEERAIAQFKEINQKLYISGQKAQWYSSLTNPAMRLVNNMAYVAVTVVGGFFALNGSISIGNIASFLIYSNQFSKPINEITSIMAQIQGAFASAERIFQLLDEPEELDAIEPVMEFEHCTGRVSFLNVDFSYTKEKSLITKMNLEVNPGDTVAIVGPTGAGKTTLVNLLMGFYPVDGGTIRIDDKELNHVKKDALRKSIGMVLQDSWLFHGSIADNIAYGKENASREDIISAAKSANAHGFIKRFPEGYDTLLEEDGNNLSQGEKQLLTIARIMLLNPPMLILDEATSNIDTRTEVMIGRGISEMRKGKTSFIIAHRLSTIRDADVILVMNKGNIVEQGNHMKLLEQRGFYYSLYHSQFTV